MKSESWLIIEVGGALVVVILIAFFKAPVYEKAVWFGLGVLATQFANLIGYKFGRSMPQQAGDAKTGESSRKQTETTTTVVSPAQPLPEALAAPKLP